MAPPKKALAGAPYIKSEVSRMSTNLRYDDLPDYMTVKELKQYLRIGNNKAYELANTPGFPCLKFGTRKVFPKDQVRDWLDRKAKQGLLPRKLQRMHAVK
jgi:excisionase family DNA binding protein